MQARHAKHRSRTHRETSDALSRVRRRQDWVIEAKPGDDPNVDPFEARSAVRKVKHTKQKTQQERNRREASHAAGASSKGAGAGIDKNALKDKDDMKKYLGEAMSAAQVSTASVGRFDKMIRGEASRDKGKRKQYETATQQGASTKVRRPHATRHSR